MQWPKISIIDNGPGIHEEIKDSIFFPMITGKDKGTGLGLSITQGIISQHKGNIHFTSEPNRTEFFINIPVNTQKDIDLKLAMDKNVWVVDDDESIRWVLEKGLSDGGMDVQTFDSANKVIKKLETENPHLILTDIKMPGPSGIDLLDKVKELRPDIPVIIMTAHSDLDSAVESYEHGAGIFT